MSPPARCWCQPTKAVGSSLRSTPPSRSARDLHNAGLRSPDELRLIEAILAAGDDDDEPRLVYADYLMDRGDPRGELIIVQCRNARAATTELEDHALHLFDEGERRWLGIWQGETSTWRFRRGFLHELTIALDTFITIAPLLFEGDPYPDELVHLRALDLRGTHAPPAADVLGALLARMRLAALKLDFPVASQFFATLGPAAFASIEGLHLTTPILAEPALFAIMLQLEVDRLRTLTLDHVTPSQAIALAAAPRYPQIQRLAARVPTEAAAIALISPTLTQLTLSQSRLHGDFLVALASVRPPLTLLATRLLHVSSYAPLVALTTLEHLDLRRSNADDAALDSLLALPHLQTLNVAHTEISAAGIERILHEAPPSLRELTVTAPDLAPALVDELRERFRLHRWR